MNAILLDTWGIVQPLVILFVSIVGPVLVTWLAAKLIALMNIKDDETRLKIEAQLRDALHKSATNALRYAMTKNDTTVVTGPVLTMAKAYVEEKNPDALARLGVNQGALHDIILSKVPDLLATVVASKMPPADRQPAPGVYSSEEGGR